MLTNPESAKLLDALGPAGKAAQSHWRESLGVDWAGIEQWIAAVVPGEDGAPRTAYCLSLREPIAETSLPQSWGQPAAATHASRRFWKGAELAYYLPEAKAGRMVAIGPQELVLEIIERDAEPLLRKGLEDLVRTSDESRHFTLIVAPSYLLTDGKSLLEGDLRKLREPLAEFFDMRVPAVAVSAQFGEALFLELRMVAPADVPADSLAAQARGRLDEASRRVDQYVASLSPGPYGRQIVNRFPLMVQTACNYTRSGAEGRQALLRCYLPDVAGHNLLLGAELALAETSQSSSGAPVVAANGPKLDQGGGVQAALARQISLSFPRDTLEHCFEIMAEELGVPIVILGSDLQLEGITKNQSFGLDERERPASEILAKVLKLANPDGKLVYVVKPDDAGQETIFITTRAAAAKRKDVLPAESAKSNVPSPCSGHTRRRRYTILRVVNSAVEVVATPASEQAVELFSIQCTTCRVRLKVKDESIIGDILACPKCGSMVQVTAPEDWRQDSAAAATVASAVVPSKPSTPPAVPASSSVPPAPAAAPPALPVATPAAAAVEQVPAEAAMTLSGPATPEPTPVSSRLPADWMLWAGGLGAGIVVGATVWLLAVGRDRESEQSAVVSAPRDGPVAEYACRAATC